MTQKLGRFEVLKEIATGGMAKIFLAKQKGVEGFEKLVVIKSLHDDLKKNRQFVEMFLNEARIAARLSHPNVVQIYDLGSADGAYYIAMEFIHGESLAKLAKACRQHRKLIPLKFSLRIAAQTCEGLHYAHTKTDVSGQAMNIIHCDVSPQNILVSYEGVVKVVDFGIAKAATLVEETGGKQIKGKLVYMSPEQIQGKILDPRTDIFSLGIVLWELVTGKRLFHRKTQAETVAAVIQERIPHPREINSHVPPELDAIIMRALDRNPDRRYPNALEMTKTLQSFAHATELNVSSFELSEFLQGLFPDRMEQLRKIAAAQASGQNLGAILFDDLDFEGIEYSGDIAAEITDELSSVSSSLYTSSLPGIHTHESADMVYFRKMKRRPLVHPLFLVLGILIILAGLGFAFYPQIAAFLKNLFGG